MPINHSAGLEFPKVSIIFSARNEASNISQALASMLAQDYSDFEVIAINDRSSDGTLKAIQGFSEHARLKILDIQSLPDGWLGKNHALYQGYRISQGRWLLFTDADVTFSPQTLRLAVCHALQQKSDHLVLFPKMIFDGLLGKIFGVCFSMMFLARFRPWKITDPKSKCHLGVGAFNLVRREVYEKFGTHEAFKLEVLDDMEIGRRVKAFGFHQVPAFGLKLFSVPWIQGGWLGIMKSLEKNGFAALGYNLWFLIVVTVFALILNVLPFSAIFFLKGSAQFLALGSVLLIGLIHASMQRFNPGTFFVFFLHPVGMLLVLYVIWRSAMMALAKKGVAWRETFYSLQDLKKNQTWH